MGERDRAYPDWFTACERFRRDALGRCEYECYSRRINLNVAREPSAEEITRLLYEAEMIARFWVVC